MGILLDQRFRWTGSRQSRMFLASLSAFLAYTSVYAFRKPFTVSDFSEIRTGPLSYLTMLVIAQVVGYMLSKFRGIQLISALPRSRRITAAFGFVGVSWFSLLLFAWVPWWLGLLCFAVNGYCLGFMWGIIFSYVEGRRDTDFIGSVMAVSFIFAGGFTRSVAVWLKQHWAVTDVWVPFITGAVFVLPFIFFITCLERLPAPDAADEVARSPRKAMTRQDRITVIRRMGMGLAAVVIAYILLTIMRDIRDNFMSNMWRELGYGNTASVFARTETIIAVMVMFCMAMFVRVRNNMRVVRLLHWVVMLGFFVVGGASWLFQWGLIEGKSWMLCSGLGLYLAYIPFNCIFFDRLIASFRLNSNAGFLMYLTDAFGYLGSVGIMLWKELSTVDQNWTDFFARYAIPCSGIGLIIVVYSLLWFNQKYHGYIQKPG